MPGRNYRSARRYRRRGKGRGQPYARPPSQAYLQMVSNRKPRLPTIGAPTSLKVRLRYEHSVSVTPTVFGADQVVRANSMFDPDFTGVGHQPRGFDQWMTMYDHYHVLSSVIKVKIINHDTITDPIVVCLALSDDAPAYTSQTEALEQGRMKYQLLGSNDSSKNIATLSKTFKGKSFFGKSIMDDDFQGTAVTNPNEGAFFHIWCGNNAGTSTANKLTIHYNIEYLAVLTEPKLPPVS